MNPVVLALVKDHGPFAAQGHDGPVEAEVLHGLVRPIPVGLGPIPVLGLIDAQELGHLMFIDQNQVGVGNQIRGEVGPERGIVEEDGHTGLMPHPGGLGHRLYGAFQAKSQDLRRGQRLLGAVGIVHVDLGVGAGGVDDGVLPLGVHGDDCGSARTGDGHHLGGIDSRVAQLSQKEVCIGIGPYGSKELDMGPDAGSSGCLVC